MTTNNIKKARYFEERARKTKDVTRRERFHRAAYRYRLAAAREREATLAAAVSASAKEADGGNSYLWV